MITAGIDVGSVTTKCVLFDGKKVLGKALTQTKADPNLAAEFVYKKALEENKISKEKISFIVSTGYGRRAIDYGNTSVTEIMANATGAYWVGCPKGEIKTIIDLGGQDSKVIALEKGGHIRNFVMNDKCSAGTGRFLENMANVLGVSLEELGSFSLKSKNPIAINSTCTVFAESEIISLISKRAKKEDIIAGLHISISKKIVHMARELGVREPVFFDGGGSKNIGIKKALENALGVEIYVPENSQFIIALGAAIVAFKLATKQQK